jgi:hypothetical protein
MSLSMDEQRMLAEIERRLSAEDPKLAAKLSAFRRPGPAGRLRSPRGRIVGSLFTVALVAIISMMVYAMVPFRAHVVKPTTTAQASSNSAPARSSPATASMPNTSAQPRTGAPASGAATTTSKTTGQKTTLTRAAGHQRATTDKTAADARTPASASG